VSRKLDGKLVIGIFEREIGIEFCRMSVFVIFSILALCDVNQRQMCPKVYKATGKFSPGSKDTINVTKTRYEGMIFPLPLSKSGGEA
jgi:hypothetical protein